MDTQIPNSYKITAFIHGETDWLEFTFTTDELDKLKNPSENLSLLGGTLGAMLDDSNTAEISEGRKAEVKAILANYISNSKTYQTIKESDFHTLMLTSYRIRDGIRKGYATRFAGAIKENLEDVSVFLNGEHCPVGNHILLLNLLKKSASLYKEKYDKRSIFHDMMRQAKMMSGKIDFRSQAHPSLQ